MEPAEYRYQDKIWTPHHTIADGNCFFHSLFGEVHETNDSKCYFDKHATFRRQLWATFLIFFQNGGMSPLLVDRTHKCFFAIDKFQKKFPGNPVHLREYAESVTESHHWVLVEEIPILATLWNVKVVLFLKDREFPIIFQPDVRLLGAFPFRINNAGVREEVIRLNDEHFEKLGVSQSQTRQVMVERHEELPAIKKQENPDSDEEIEAYALQKEAYPKKRGGAGHHGGDFQVKILSLVLLNSFNKLKGWRLSTENKNAGNFDDLVLENPDGDIFIQIKHKQKETEKIVPYEALFNDTGDFSLPKYLDTFLRIKETKDKIRNVIICTNATLQSDKVMSDLVKKHDVSENNLLYFEGSHTKEFFTFEENAVKHLQLKRNVLGRYIREFFARLQFFHKFMDADSMNNAVRMLVPSIKLAKDLDSHDTFEKIAKMVQNWFDSTNSQYLLALDAAAMFCDVRSWQYCESFKEYKISFATGFDPTKLKMLNVITAGEPILHLLKIYRSVQQRNKVLFLNPNDNFDLQRQVVNVFSVVKHYTLLVLVVPVDPANKLMQQVQKRLTKIEEMGFKKLIFVDGEENEIVRYIMSSNPTKCEKLKEDIRFSDLSRQSQNEMSEKNIVFQGIDMTLIMLLGEHIDDFIDVQTLAKLARNDLVKIGTELVHTYPNIGSYYISRKLKRFQEEVREEQFRQLDFLPKEKIVVICDTAGMGKTTILTELAIRIKKDHPSIWVSRVDFNSHSSTFEAADRTSKSVDVEDLLKEQLSNKLTRKIFNRKDNVVLMLDAVDEVSPSYIETITEMIKGAKVRENLRRIFVTTRPHLRQTLEQHLEVSAFNLQPFTKENQTEFLTRYWTHELELADEGQRVKCETYAKALIVEMSGWIKEGAENSFAGIPLQTRMLAEVFQENSQLEDGQSGQWQYCKEFLSSNNKKPLLPKRINLIRLYELFVEKKCDEFVKKFAENSVTKQMLKEKFEECHEFHFNLGLAIVFFEDECRLFGRYRQSKEFRRSLVTDYVLRVGIVHEVEGSLTFIHRTFAEYFVAKCLVLELKDGPIKEGFCSFLLTEVLRRAEYHIVRLFFDAFIQDELLLIPDSTLEAFRRLDYMSILGNINTTLLHLLAEDGLVGTIKFFFTCIKFNVTGNRDTSSNVVLVDCTNLECQTPLHRACLQGHLNMAKTLIDAGANADLANANGETALHLAASKGHLDLVKYLADVNGLNVHKLNTCKETAVHCAVRGGHLEVVKFLVEHHRVSHKGLYNSALHLAVSADHQHIVKYLVRSVGVDINILDVNEWTPLHAAASKRHFSTVKFLVGNGANVNAVDKEGNTACLASIFCGFSEIVQYLLENGTDTELPNRYGQTIGGIAQLILQESGGSEGDE